jgi:hypothetical protein
MSERYRRRIMKNTAYLVGLTVAVLAALALRKSRNHRGTPVDQRVKDLQDHFKSLDSVAASAR